MIQRYKGSRGFKTVEDTAGVGGTEAAKGTKRVKASKGTKITSYLQQL